MSASSLMKLVWCFRNETDTYVWMILLENLKSISACLLNSLHYDKFKKFFKKLIEKVVDKLGFQIRDDEGKTIKHIILSKHILHFFIF